MSNNSTGLAGLSRLGNRTKVWRNWARTQSCQPAYTATPADSAAVASAIGAAISAGQKVRPLGAGHSFTPVATTAGHRIQLDGLSGVVELDRQQNTVTLKAGTRLRDLPGLLRPLGYALPNQGDVDPQSLAGAISTGTHGTGVGFTGFAGTVRAFRIIGADGVEKHCYPGAAGEAGELFRLARLGLGCFGVITEVTMDMVPAFDLRADEHREDFEEIRRSFAERSYHSDHLEFFWFPGQREALVKHNTRVPAAPSSPARTQRLRTKFSQARTFVDEELVGNLGLLAVCELARAVPAATDTLNRFATHAVPQRIYTQPAHEVFVSSRRVRFAEMEYSVPLEAVGEVLDEIRTVISRRGFQVSFPIEVRATAADDVALSTAYGRDSGYIAVHRYWKESYREYFDAIEPIFKAYEGRPHWGKLHTLTASDLAERYPLFDEVVALRRKLDPEGVFLNSHLESLLG